MTKSGRVDRDQRVEVGDDRDVNGAATEPGGKVADDSGRHGSDDSGDDDSGHGGHDD